MKRLLIFTTVATALISACGGGGSSGSPPESAQPPGTSNTTVQVNLGDGPADRLLAVGMTVNSLTLHHTNGSAVSVLTSPRPIEMMHLMGTVTPLAFSSVPQGTYTGATMTFGNAAVTHVDAATGQFAQRSAPGPMVANVSFNPPMTVGATPTVINFDMDMAASVTIDANGNVTMTPTLSARANPMVAGGRHPEDGGMRGMAGAVSGISGDAFTLSTTQGLTGTSLMTYSGTHFSDLNGMHMMTGNMLVSVDATLRPDGTWIVDHVQSQTGAGGAMAAGVITGVAGNPPSQLTLVMHDGVGDGMVSSSLAGTTTVNLGSTTQFVIDADDVDLSGLPFTPQFDPAHLSKGQAIRAWSNARFEHDGHGMGGMFSGGTVTASSIYLKHQGLRGTMSGYATNGSQASFTLTMPADSAFAALTGTTTVTVYQQGGTQLRGLTSLANGHTVLARGLLFLDSGVYRLVASRLAAS